MAGGSAHLQFNGTLAASTVDTVTFDHYSRHVIVENLTAPGAAGAGPIYVVAGATAPADPTVGGAEEYAVAPGQSIAVPVHGQWPSADSANWPLSQVVVKLISGTGVTPAYSVSLV